ncbi:MAG: hypothetical protein ACQGVC_10490 [Myxococcota bacterium]
MADTRQTGWLELFRDPPGSAIAASLCAFRLLLLVHGAVRLWDRYLVESGHALHLAMACVLTLAACAAARPRFGRAAVWAGLWTVAIEIAVTHGVANHVWAEGMLLGLFALLDPEQEDEAVWLLCALRWMVALLLLWAGLQKLLYGTYFRAEFLCWMIAQRPAFATALGGFVAADELARLTSLDPTGLGAGPFRTDSVWLILGSNAVWIAELVLPAMLVPQRLRAVGAVLAALFVLSIQLVAREAMFGLLYSQLVLLNLPGNGYRRVAPVYALAYAYMAASLLGWVPNDWIVKRGGF